MKIAVMGYSGSGKSTLARKLSELYKIPVLHLDTVQFLPGWVERDRDEARSFVSDFMQNDSWVIDGNYHSFDLKERLAQADKIIILLFPRLLCLYRAFGRYKRYKNRTRVDMAEGCIEKLDLEFIWWILYKGRTKDRRGGYSQILIKYPQKTVIMKNQKQVDQYLKLIRKSAL
jgi:adenylate kinase family enzyme